MVEAANAFVGHIVSKQIAPVYGAAMSGCEIPMSENEVKTFDSALQFLKRQFDAGHSTTEPHEKRLETEDVQEI